MAWWSDLKSRLGCNPVVVSLQTQQPKWPCCIRTTLHKPRSNHMLTNSTSHLVRWLINNCKQTKQFLWISKQSLYACARAGHRPNLLLRIKCLRLVCIQLINKLNLQVGKAISTLSPWEWTRLNSLHRQLLVWPLLLCRRLKNDWTTVCWKLLRLKAV